MRNKSTQGFTLIELLIVIAIIGILAAVLIPNLLNARTQAQIRAAQAFSSNVVTAVTADLSADVTAKPSDYDTLDCMANLVPKAGSDYSWTTAPSNVTSCTVSGDDTTGIISVAVVIPQGTITNGSTPQ